MGGLLRMRYDALSRVVLVRDNATFAGQHIRPDDSG